MKAGVARLVTRELRHNHGASGAHHVTVLCREAHHKGLALVFLETQKLGEDRPAICCKLQLLRLVGLQCAAAYPAPADVGRQWNDHHDGRERHGRCKGAYLVIEPGLPPRKRSAERTEEEEQARYEKVEEICRSMSPWKPYDQQSCVEQEHNKNIIHLPGACLGEHQRQAEQQSAQHVEYSPPKRIRLELDEKELPLLMKGNLVERCWCRYNNKRKACDGQDDVGKNGKDALCNHSLPFIR